MSVAVILLIFGAFIRDCCAIHCYNCTTLTGGSCDDPLDMDTAQVARCPTEANACIAAKLRHTYAGIMYKYCSACMSEITLGHRVMMGRG